MNVEYIIVVQTNIFFSSFSPIILAHLFIIIENLIFFNQSITTIYVLHMREFHIHINKYYAKNDISFKVHSVLCLVSSVLTSFASLLFQSYQFGLTNRPFCHKDL